MSELAARVRRRAGGRCEYCQLPQSAFQRPFHVEHIVARQHGGRAQPDNLALARWSCNLKKGPNLSGVDPQTGRLAALFNPRKDDWGEHFPAVNGALIPLGVAIRGLTPTGRATAQVLGLNDEMRQLIRHELWIEGIYQAAIGQASGPRLCFWITAGDCPRLLGRLSTIPRPAALSTCFLSKPFG